MKVRLVADNNVTRSMGLMNQKPLHEDECAYFYFDNPGRHSFWNKNVDFPISLIFCDKEGKVEDIKYLKAQQLNGVYPDSNKIVHVVEAHFEAPEKFKIKKGSNIKVRNNEVFFE